MITLVGSLVVYPSAVILAWILCGFCTMVLFKLGVRYLARQTFHSLGGLFEKSDGRTYYRIDEPRCPWSVTLHEGVSDFGKDDANRMICWGPIGLLGMCFTISLATVIDIFHLIGYGLSHVGERCARLLGLLE